MKTFFLLLSIIILLFSACNNSQITSFEECVNAGNVVREGFPSSCSDGINTFFDTKSLKYYVSDDNGQCSILRFKCEEGLKPFFNEIGCGCEPVNVTACTKEYRPVCAEVRFRCSEDPSCTPVKETFANECMAKNANAVNFVEGVCETDKNKDYCIDNGGKWVAQTKECEGISKEVCESISGSFNSCASACRNDHSAEVCTMQCIQVCTFN